MGAAAKGAGVGGAGSEKTCSIVAEDGYRESEAEWKRDLVLEGKQEDGTVDERAHNTCGTEEGGSQPTRAVVQSHLEHEHVRLKKLLLFYQLQRWVGTEGLTLCGVVGALTFMMPFLLTGCGYSGADAVWCGGGTYVYDAFLTYRQWVWWG